MSRAQVRALTDAIRAANPLALIAIDEEGGDVTRLYYATGSPYPGNALLGRIDDLDLTAEVARSVALELRAVGVNLNFAPDADINSNPDNPVIGVRSFGADPELVSAHTAAWVAAHEAEGVAVSAKHFPGHGDTAQDSHLALPVVDLPLEELRERELRPFLAAIQAGARTIMSSHVLLPQLDPDRPATFSRAILDGVLRGELGFEGVIVSDALDMVGASGEIGIPAAAVARDRRRLRPALHRHQEHRRAARRDRGGPRRRRRRRHAARRAARRRGRAQPARWPRSWRLRRRCRPSATPSPRSTSTAGSRPSTSGRDVHHRPGRRHPDPRDRGEHRDRPGAVGPGAGGRRRRPPCTRATPCPTSPGRRSSSARTTTAAPGRAT